MTARTATITWGALGSLIPILLAVGLLLWRGGSLAEMPAANRAAIADHEARLRALETDRVAVAELRADVRWIRARLEGQPPAATSAP